jgi:beta-lactam-binding protein with PASTA domain
LVGAFVVSLLAVAVSGTALFRAVRYTGSHASAPRVTVPLGPALVTVPSVINKNGMIAANALSQLNLKYTIVTGPSVSTNKDNVITQDPNPGTKVPEGSAVLLKLSSGPL